MMLILVFVVYCAMLTVASLAGGWLPTLLRLTHVRIQFMMSLVSGIMLGVALLHMLPHALEFLPKVSWVAGSMLAGLLVMFFLLRIFHVHHYGESEGGGHQHHDHHCVHGEHPPEGTRQFRWLGLFLGLTVHSLLDGVAVAASLFAEAQHWVPGVPLVGLGTFLAVLLHKPLDALSITSLMRADGYSDRRLFVVNALFALTCPLGAMLFWLGASQMSSGQEALVGCALGFSAGFFLCIALSDLLPEVQFHSHDRVKLSAALLIGVGLALLIEMFHTHDHGHSGAEHQQHHHHEHNDDPH